jgi:elongation factor Ts
MATITAALVKELREKTGVGMMDCKNALNENDGDIEAATDWLRAKGLAKAAKKSGRVASEGLVGMAVDGNRGAVVEVNSETDFVARNDTFQSMVGEIAKLALEADGDVEKLGAMAFPGSAHDVNGHVTEMVATIGENMNLRRAGGVSVSNGVVASYMHNATAPGLGRIAVLVGLESDGDKDKLNAFGKQIAMHVAATNPLALTADDLDADVVAREKAVQMEQARESGKPEEIIEKMVEGRMKKYFAEVVLLSQIFVIDGESRVEDAIKAAANDIGAPITMNSFVRLEIGEGVEKKEEDFAAEVAAAASGA